MTGDRLDRMSETPLPQYEELLHGSSPGILDALDMTGVGEIDIAFERPPSYPHAATFD